MTFTMPELSRRDIDVLTTKALDDACWNLSGVRDHPEDASWSEAAAESSAAYAAWVNYSRQTYPDMPSGFMLDYEKQWGPGLPFRDGDRWEFNPNVNSWVIVKPSGKSIVTRDAR